MSQEGIALGEEGEEETVTYLKKRGYTILEKNYRCELGEIDIIAREKNYMAFIEVKTRESLSYGLPQLAVGKRKQRQISRVALYYLTEQGLLGKADCRFDVVAVTKSDKGEQIELIKDAFRLEGSHYTF
ncbi:MAG: YraN family protein [bacterium]